jgi:transposase-like protein
MRIKCKHCESEKTRKNGTNYGVQRYKCKECKRTFSVPRHTAETKRSVLLHYLNGCGVRKTALFCGVSHTTVINWVRESHGLLAELRKGKTAEPMVTGDIIELDEIYTFVQKKATEQ